MNGMERMISIAVVDDDDADAERLQRIIERYFANDRARYALRRFKDGETFLDGYGAGFDMVFLDIEMPGDDGMTVARRLRDKDMDIILVFTTKVTQYAASGYDVDAIGYLVKPVDYYAFALKMGKAERLAATKRNITIGLASDGETIYVSSKDIHYVEVRDHALIYHMTQGIWKVWGRLRDAAEDLAPAGFVQCNRYCLINPAWVSTVSRDEVTVAGTRIDVSKSKRRALMQTLVRYHGGVDR